MSIHCRCLGFVLIALAVNDLCRLAGSTAAAARDHCRVEGAAASILKAAVSPRHLSARAYHRILKVARTIADLEGVFPIAPAHVAEAVQYRPRGGA